MPMWQNVLQLIVVLIVFILILMATYATTKWIGKTGLVQLQSKNISVIETFKIAPNKYVQIIKIGTKYYAISIAKDTVSFMTELEEKQLDLRKEEMQESFSFKEVLDKVLPKHKK